MKNAFLSVLAIVLFVSANAQTSQTQTVTLNLQNQIDISLVPGSDNGTEFTFASTNDYASGLTNTDASQFRVRSNRPWKVTVAAATANFTGGSNDTPMPSSKLGVRLKGATGFTSLATTAVDLTNGQKGPNNVFTVDYNANPGFDYDAGTYTLNVVYTATQQ